jgi:SAM-dependent methyltransferase
MNDDVNSPRKWEADYGRKTDGWDLGGPTPIFKSLASSGQFKPGRMIVLGAGRGHDAREFARNGFQVTAVDFASQAVQEMRRLADPAAPVKILQNDIFALPERLDQSFDYVLEYTCFCAIDPKRRAEYADVVTRLLKPNGIYIDLAFPLDGRKGGPPFALRLGDPDLFQERGFGSYRVKNLRVISPRGAEELFIFKSGLIRPILLLQMKKTFKSLSLESSVL